MNEVWKEIPGFVYYLVSDFGRVKSLKNKTERILKPSFNKGYATVVLSNNRRYAFKVHKLVAMSFLGNVPNGTHYIVVDHINGNRSDNRLSNLQLITQRDNVVKGKFNGNSSSKKTGVSFDKNLNKWFCVICIKKLVFLGRYESEEMASSIYEIASLLKNRFNGDRKIFREMVRKEYKRKTLRLRRV